MGKGTRSGGSHARGKGGRGRGRGSSHRAHALRDFGYDNERPDSAIDVVDEGNEKKSSDEAGSSSGDADEEPATIDVPVAMWVSSRAKFRQRWWCL